MRRDDIIQQLKRQHSGLSEFKVKSLALFGSVARDEARADSDADFLVEFDGPVTFDQYMGLKIFLEDLLHCSVDLVTRQGIRRELAPYIEKEAIHVA